MSLNKKVLFLIFILIVLNGIVYIITEVNSKQRIQIALNSHLRHIETQFNVLTKKIIQDTDTIFARMSNNETLLNIIEKVSTEKDDKQFQLFHDAVYSRTPRDARPPKALRRAC